MSKLYNMQMITDLTTVAGNSRDFQQIYKIGYYPKSVDLPQKIVLSIYEVPAKLKEQNIMPKPRSLYFSSIEQLKTLILNLTKSYFFFLDKKTDPVIPISEFRLLQLDTFVKDLIKTQKENWR